MRCCGSRGSSVHSSLELRARLRFVRRHPRPYGFTNLALYFLCIAAIWGLLREAGLTRTAAWVGAFAWALNPHGINMAVVWLSGRTSLLLTACAALSARAFLRRQRVAGSLMLLGALLSKEEATVLPFVLMVGSGRSETRTATRWPSTRWRCACR